MSSFAAARIDTNCLSYGWGPVANVSTAALTEPDSVIVPLTVMSFTNRTSHDMLASSSDAASSAVGGTGTAGTGAKTIVVVAEAVTAPGARVASTPPLRPAFVVSRCFAGSATVVARYDLLYKYVTVITPRQMKNGRHKKTGQAEERAEKSKGEKGKREKKKRKKRGEQQRRGESVRSEYVVQGMAA